MTTTGRPTKSGIPLQYSICAMFAYEKMSCSNKSRFQSEANENLPTHTSVSGRIQFILFRYLCHTQIRKSALSRISLNCPVNIRVMQKAQNRLYSLRQHCFHFIRGFYSHDSFYKGINYANPYHDFIQLHGDCKSKLHARTQTVISTSRDFARQFSNAYAC